MAARSALKNKKNQKMREAIGDIAVQCGDTSEGEGVKVGHLDHPPSVYLEDTRPVDIWKMQLLLVLLKA